MVADRLGKRWLLSTARAVAVHLRERSVSTSIRIRRPARASATWSEGWLAVIGDLGRNRPRMELWYDRYSGHMKRKLWYGFYSPHRDGVRGVTRRVDEKLSPIR